MYCITERSEFALEFKPTCYIIIVKMKYYTIAPLHIKRNNS